MERPFANTASTTACIEDADCGPQLCRELNPRQSAPPAGFCLVHVKAVKGRYRRLAIEVLAAWSYTQYFAAVRVLNTGEAAARPAAEAGETFVPVGIPTYKTCRCTSVGISSAAGDVSLRGSGSRNGRRKGAGPHGGVLKRNSSPSRNTRSLAENHRG